MQKPTNTVQLHLETTPSLGIAPGALVNRDSAKRNIWCPKPEIEFDSWCNPNNPKLITYKEISKAMNVLREHFPVTPLLRSRCCVQFGLEVNYKLEIFHRTGSFNERGALYTLLMLKENQRKFGVITASTGSWAMALAYYGHKLDIPVTTVLPLYTLINVVEMCKGYGATVILNGKSLAEAKNQAFIVRAESGATYLNSYDHPYAIAAAGSIGVEIMEQLPQTDAILIPVGGGGLLAGISTAVKHIKPEVLIYGIEPEKCCGFYKAMKNEHPYHIIAGRSIAGSLAISTPGHNAFHTAKPSINKMVLVNDDWISRAVLHLTEEERFVADGAGATSLSALFGLPNILPELRGKTVVCVISGGNIDTDTLPRCIERAKAVEGRIIKMTVTLPADETTEQLKIFSTIANLGCNVRQYYTEHAWLTENDFYTIYLTLTCETRDIKHACTLKRVMERLFPNMCHFLEEPFSPIPICSCFAKKLP
ncbi:putative threonine dehydratase isoform X1 [Achroia grisella]|uniref:putative threonine dehydratase isoform X1 n=1 Tax=Achroia grisella TaxID=688607 RepID=UPI0027D2E3E1|nr:putative threonine dehydratase isoform X1 [Achroia grisella]